MKEYKAIKVVPELHQIFKILSAQEGKNMAEMLEELIRLYKKSKEEKPINQYNKIYKPIS